MEADGEIRYYLIEDPLGEGETIGYSRHQLNRIYEEYKDREGVKRILYVPRGLDGGETLRRFEENLCRRLEEKADRRMDWAWLLRFCAAAICIYTFEPLFKLAYIPLVYHLNRYIFISRELVEAVLDPIAIPFTTILGFILGLSPLILTLILTHQYMARISKREGEIAKWLRDLLSEEAEIRESPRLEEFRESIHGLVEEARRSLKALHSPSLEERVEACRRLMRDLAKMQAEASYHGLETLVDYYHRLKTSFYKLSGERRILKRDKALKRWLGEVRG
ncbi:hypothetical protein CW701_00430 [Candidatus Bathyarchaeota archaeon]|nr:MAG: hypothetical protein CW701_00430 [Candidatus Bathyarchaeota archaeon]